MTIRTGSVRANGLTFHFHELGEGPLALLLHGFPDTPHGWHHFMPALAAAGYRVVAPFTRGYAPTEVPATSRTTLDELAADALALIDALGHSSAVLVGHDWGGATAYLAATLAPEKISRLIVAGIPHTAALKPSLSLLWAARHFLALSLPGAASRAHKSQLAVLDHLYRRWSPTWRFGPEETAPVKAALAELKNVDAAFGYYRGARVAPQAFRRKISVPTLVVAGADDPTLGLDVYERAKRRFTGRCELVSLPGGHFVHRESPGAFAQTALKFLKE